MDSDGNTLSVLEELLNEKVRRRKFWKKYCSCVCRVCRRLKPTTSKG